MNRFAILLMICMLFGFAVGCNNAATSKKTTQTNNPPPPPPPGDTTAPSAVTGITVTSVTHNTATTQWIATGDDGNVNTASGYVVRYYTSPINGGNYSLASIANVAITPLPAGQIMSAVVTGLTPETTYYFIVTARDEAYNWSPIPFNGVGTTDSPPAPPPDVTPPAAITDLTEVSSTPNKITWGWTVPADDNVVTSYLGWYAQFEINEGNLDQATEILNLPQPLAAGLNQDHELTGLDPNQTYHIVIKAIDAAGNVSVLSNDAIGTTDAPPPLPNLKAEILPTTPDEHQITSGAINQVVSRMKFTASAVEAIVVESLRLFNTGTAPDNAIIQVRLVEGVIVLASTVVTGGYAEFTGLNLIVPAGGSRSIDVVCDFANSNDVPIISGKTVWFGIRNLEDDWQQGAAPAAPNDAFNGMGETGDIKAIGQVSGMTLLNSADPLIDQIIGDCGVGNNLGDGVGLIDRGGNILTKKQHLVVNAPVIVIAANQPVGFQGIINNPPPDRKILGIEVNAPQIAAPAPQELELPSLKITIKGDAEADGFELYGDDPFNPIAVSAAVHRTTRIGGDPANPADHVSDVVTTVTFVLQGLNRFIPYGTQKAFAVRAKVYALTTGAQQRSLEVSIASFGSPTTPGDVVFRDNGDLAANPDSFEWSWIDGVAPLLPPAPMQFSGMTHIP